MEEINEIASYVFVYAKDKKIKVLGIEEAKISQHDLILDGWEHTATMDACMWIEYIHNTSRNWNEDIRSLSKKINQLTKKQ